MTAWAGLLKTHMNDRGQIESLPKKYPGETLAHVRYGYNPLGELLEVVQLNPGEPDYSVQFTYDMRGLTVSMRVIQLAHLPM